MSKTRETIADVRAQRSELTQKVQSLEVEKAGLTELKDRLTKDLTEANDMLEARAKELSEANRMKDYYNRCMGDSATELNELHAFLDALPDPPPRTVRIEEGYPRDITLKLTSRLTQWLIKNRK